MKKSLLEWTLLCSAGPLLFFSQALCAVAGLSAGAAKLDITPNLKLSNWVTHKPYNEALEPVYARAVVLEQAGRRIAIVSWDLLYAMEGSVEKVRSGIRQTTGIKESDILICATHNHSAPWSPICGHPLTRAEQKVLHSFLADPEYPAWADKVIKCSIDATAKADKDRRPAAISIARAYIGDVMFNRRPMRPDGSVQTLTGVTDAFVMAKGLRFGRVDPTLTLLMIRDESQKTVASIYHAACHAVVVYPAYDGLSGDWPGAVSASLEKQLGGEAVFLQGCAGDINPIRRGVAARDDIAKIVADRALKASKVCEPLVLTNKLAVTQRMLNVPVREELKAELQRDTLPAEVQVITCGDLAFVALPGEPLSALSTAIQDNSPFPHTIVLGYSNGLGVQYVGMPGERARGGYEMGVRSLGADQCGQILVDAAVELLKAARQPEPSR